MKPSPPQSLIKTQNLAQLIYKTTHIHLSWRDQDYGEILDHQLNAPLAADMESLFPDIRTLTPHSQALTFREVLFKHPASLSELHLVKRFAKHMRQNKEGGYPEEVAMVIYYGALASAELHTHTHITELTRADAKRGYQWARSRPWLPPDLRALFHRVCDQSSDSTESTPR